MFTNFILFKQYVKLQKFLLNVIDIDNTLIIKPCTLK